MMSEAAINIFCRVVWVCWAAVNVFVGAGGGCRRRRLRAGFTVLLYRVRRVHVLWSVTLGFTFGVVVVWSRSGL